MATDRDLPLPDLDPDALRRAEAALQALSDRYITWAEADLVRLEACMTHVLTHPESCAETLAQLLGVAHDMKGQGATFDYPLVSELGGCLCSLLKSAPHPDSAEMERITALATAMGQVIRQRLSGDGGIEGQRLRTLL